MSTKDFDTKENLFPSNKLLIDLTKNLLDPLAKELVKDVHWVSLKDFSKSYTPKDDLLEYPVVITGEGPPVLLLHGFDSCFLEFRRLVPLLKAHHQLIIPDMFGFGFCPRPKNVAYGAINIFNHLDAILHKVVAGPSVGVIGASMGGAVSMEIARRHPEKVKRVLLLSPAGLTGKPMPIPPLLDHLGVWFLSRPEVRRSLCRQAFANPDESVGDPENQIASIHLKVSGWDRSLAAFARSGGIANLGLPLPNQPVKVIFGSNDRILSSKQKTEIFELFQSDVQEIKGCGHLPHLDCPNTVAKTWLGEIN